MVVNIQNNRLTHIRAMGELPHNGKGLAGKQANPLRGETETIIESIDDLL